MTSDAVYDDGHTQDLLIPASNSHLNSWPTTVSLKRPLCTRDGTLSRESIANVAAVMLLGMETEAASGSISIVIDVLELMYPMRKTKSSSSQASSSGQRKKYHRMMPWFAQQRKENRPAHLVSQLVSRCVRAVVSFSVDESGVERSNSLQ